MVYQRPCGNQEARRLAHHTRVSESGGTQWASRLFMGSGDTTMLMRRRRVFRESGLGRGLAEEASRPMVAAPSYVTAAPIA